MNKIHNFQSELIKKVQLTESIYLLDYIIPETFVFTPGQFVGARVIPTHTRAYSVADINNNVMTLLVDVKPQGIASKYFEKVQVGESTNLLGPYGIYKVKDTDLPKVFVSTGTGIAPFVAMIKDLRKNNPNIPIYNFFGIKVMEHDIALPFFKDLLADNFKFINCVSRQEVEDLNAVSNQEIRKGRVTEVIPTYNFDWANTEFYICGGPEMVTSTAILLKELGADKVFIEKY